MNPTLRTIGLFAVMTLIFMGIGALFLYFYSYNFMYSMFAFFLFLLIIQIFVYFASDKLVLRRYRVRLVSESEYPKLHSIVAEVAEKTGVPKPKVGVMESATPNAFATGRNPKKSVVVVTSSILRLLSDEELKGVIAHEMAHIRDRDILLVTTAAILASATAFLARIFMWRSIWSSRRQNGGEIALMALALAGAAIAVLLLRLAISRQREFKADEVGARTIGDPRPLESALLKLDGYNTRWPMRKGNPASSSLFIVNPFKGSFVSLLSTHPPTSARIRHLQELEPELLGYDLSSAKSAVKSAPYKIK